MKRVPSVGTNLVSLHCAAQASRALGSRRCAAGRPGSAADHRRPCRYRKCRPSRPRGCRRRRRADIGADHADVVVELVLFQLLDQRADVAGQRLLLGRHRWRVIDDEQDVDGDEGPTGVILRAMTSKSPSSAVSKLTVLVVVSTWTSPSGNRSRCVPRRTATLGRSPSATRLGL